MNDEPQLDAVEEPATRAKPPRSAWRHWTRHSVKLSAVLLLTPLVIAMIVAVAILDRDITAPSWIKSRVEATAGDFLSGGALSFGEVTVNLGRDLHPRVTLRDTTLTDAAGTTVARIPVVRGLMSPRGLVLQGEALMQDVQLSGAQINLRRNADGTVALAFQTGGQDVGQAGSFAELLDQVDQAFEQPALAALETIRADGLIVNYQDARAGKAWTVDGGQINLDLRDDQTDLRGAFSVLSGGAGVTDLALTYNSPRGSRAADFGVNVTDAFASDIAAQSAALSWMADINAPISLTLRTVMDEEGALGPLNATLALGRGALQPNAATEPIRFDAAKAYLNFDPATQTISFDQIEVSSDWGNLRANGQAFLKDIEDGLPQSLVGQFSFADTLLNPPGLYENGLTLPNTQVDMRLNLSPFAIDLGQVFVQTETVNILSKGRFAATDAGWDVAVDAGIDQFDQAALLQLWPAQSLGKVRGWLERQVPLADYSDLHFAFRKRPGAAAQVAGNYAFENAEIWFLNSMPPIVGAAGLGTFTADTFTTTLDAGHVAAPVGGRLDATGSVLHMPDLKQDPRPAEHDIRLSGSMTAVMSMMDLPPLGFTTRAKLPVDVADGSVNARINLRHPMRRGNTPADFDVEVTAELRGINSNRLIPNRRLSADRLSLFADQTRLEISGAATVDGIGMNGSWVQRFDGTGSRLQAGLTLSENAMRAFNVSLPPGSVAGTAPARIDLRIPSGQAPQYTISSDLRGMRVAIPAVGWAKARQTPGDLRVAGRLGDAPQVDEIAISGGGLSARGDVTFKGDGSLDRARFSQVQVGNWLNAPITLRGRGEGRPVGVEIRGGAIDLRRANFGPSSGSATGPISIALDRLQVTQGIALNRFAGEFTSSGGFAGQFTAKINDAANIQGTVAPRNGRSAVRLLSDDAGGVARATGLLRGARGGTLDLTLLPTGGDGTFDGALAIRSLRIQDAPAIAALLDAISVVGLLQQLDGQGIAFDEVDARFRLTPQQVILTQSSAVGPGLGISLDGIYTLASKQMDFQGVISPLYIINAIGSIFTRRGEGLIGFNFNIGGTADAPRVSVNPLSALTPGMFREIFRRAPPQVPQ
ncbi:DUF3971 domain-containing protein [Loktanella sp. F6476L]|uniref:AsmA-like C-terminal region-containing protein n=1 Tax=Loktanella sp. F6476L TaxID=2926405 RepID=UPI001FF423E8|nr:AsmA-like C-terminal region-containing protein [Loktanella sp. F6476L]MCK0119668.1 DUF3971 domain-containing protein [Loktanella sp. F6476L]